MANRESDRRRPSAATTFREDEIRFLDQFVRAIARGADINQFIRRPEFASVRRKVQCMVETVERKRAALVRDEHVEQE